MVKSKDRIGTSTSSTNSGADTGDTLISNGNLIIYTISRVLVAITGDVNNGDTFNVIRVITVEFNGLLILAMETFGAA